MPRTAALTHATRVEPTTADHDLFTELEHEGQQGKLVLHASGGRTIELPDSLARLVLAAAHDLAQGNTVLALPLETRLTPNEAADLLGISRPFLLRLIDSGQITAEHLPGSSHRHLRLADVLEFQARRERRREATQAISEIVEEYDLPY
jgi:excisionase family DNA binding protein